jgi:tripartite tricarboxylate transporter TctB family protein
MRVGQTLLGLGLLALSGFLIWETRTFPPAPPGIPVGPADYPRAVLLFIAALSVLMILQAWRAPARETLHFAGRRYVLGSVILFAAYIELVTLFGYFPATVAYLPVTLCLLRVRRLGPVLVTSLGFILFIYVFFVRILGLPLPEGTLRIG